MQVIKSTVGPWAQFGRTIGPAGGYPVITRYAIQQLTGECPAWPCLYGWATQAGLTRLAANCRTLREFQCPEQHSLEDMFSLAQSPLPCW